MTLKDDLYTIREKKLGEDGGLEYTIGLNPDCLIYHAHFPGNPITPGVCILQIASELLQEHFGHRMELKTANNVKYMAVISPTENAEVVFAFTSLCEDDSVLKAKFVVRSGTTIFTKASMTYEY